MRNSGKEDGNEGTMGMNHGNEDGPLSLTPFPRAQLPDELQCSSDHCHHCDSVILNLTKSCLYKEEPVRNWLLLKERSPGHQNNLQGRSKVVRMKTRQEGRMVRTLIFRGSELFGQLSCSRKYSLSSSTLLIFKLTL